MKSLIYLLVLGVLVAAGSHAEAAGPNSEARFSEWDTDQDGEIVNSELPAENHADFEWADLDLDGSLSPKECKEYVGFWRRIQDGVATIPADVKVLEDVAYVVDGHPRQKLDLYLPKQDDSKPLPIVIWIHGGGWQRGTKDMLNRQAIVLQNGFALASVNYRLTNHAPFPAQIHDCKAAIRFLRTHADQYGIDPDRFGAWGSSAGGHLVSLLGTSGGVAALEGDLGETAASSHVQAVCDWFGPSDMVMMGRLQGPHEKPKFENPKSAIAKLVGGPLSQRQDVARQSSPATYISQDDAPFLIMHGDQDPLVPLEQSETFHRLLTESNVRSNLITIEGAGHAFFTEPEQLQHVVDFFLDTL